MQALEQEQYLADPCGAASLPYRKAKQMAVPEDVTMIREDQFDPARCSGKDEPYFKMIHRLRDIRRPVLPAQYQEIPCSAGDLSRHISECYAEERLPADELRARAMQPDFDAGLWLAVMDTTNGRIAASGIAEVDPEIREGTLEWIQVSAAYRRQGLGRYIVSGLLHRLHGKADFVTVSGRMNNPDNPLALYRACGFTDCVVWHIIRKR